LGVVVVCIKVVVQGKGADESTERVAYMMKSRGPRMEALGNTTAGRGIQGRERVIRSDTEGAR